VLDNGKALKNTKTVGDYRLHDNVCCVDKCQGPGPPFVFLFTSEGASCIGAVWGDWRQCRHRTLRKAILYPVWVALGDDMRRRHVMGCPCCACCRRH
jgi:hypothetical protein